MLLADVRVAVEEVVEVVAVLELVELVAVVRVAPRNALAGELDRAEGVVRLAADVADRGDELGLLLVPVAEDEVRGQRAKEGHGLGRLDVAAVEHQLDVLLAEQADGVGDHLVSVVRVADDPDPHIALASCPAWSHRNTIPDGAASGESSRRGRYFFGVNSTAETSATSRAPTFSAAFALQTVATARCLPLPPSRWNDCTTSTPSCLPLAEMR